MSSSVLRLGAGAAVCALSAELAFHLGAGPGRTLAVWALAALGGSLALSGPESTGAARQRTAVLILVLGAVACQAPGVLRPPSTSTDAYRYAWDGRVQLAGVSPYRFAPGDDELAALRDPLLFPGLGPAEAGGLDTVRPLPEDPALLSEVTVGDDRTVINRPRVPTIYPPVAQAYFAAVAALTPWHSGTLGLQLAAAVLAVGLTAALSRMLLRGGRDPRWALLWGWSPLVALEAANGAHVDVLSAVLVVGACAVLGSSRTRGGRLLAGALLGLAVATKLIPLLLLPALTALRRGGARELLVVPSAVLATVATYVPHVLVAGSLVLGFLPAYLVEEGFDDGRSRFSVIALLPLDEGVRWPIAVVVAVVAASAAMWTADPARPWDTACWLLGVALLVATPAYPWYALPLVALAALARRPEWLAVAVAAGAGYTGHAGPPEPVDLWAHAALVVLVVTALRQHQLVRDAVESCRAGARAVHREGADH